MLSALGANVGWIYTGMFVVGSFLAGLGGALVTPVKSIVHRRPVRAVARLPVLHLPRHPDHDPRAVCR